VYQLRAGGQRLPNGGFCQVYRVDGRWCRKTDWCKGRTNGGTRYGYFANLDDALLSGIAWARRRERQDKAA
jgi:hypothetical protein